MRGRERYAMSCASTASSRTGSDSPWSFEMTRRCSVISLAAVKFVLKRYRVQRRNGQHYGTWLERNCRQSLLSMFSGFHGVAATS